MVQGKPRPSLFLWSFLFVKNSHQDKIAGKCGPFWIFTSTSLRLVLTRWHIAATNRSMRTGRIFVKIFVAATEFCLCNKSHKFSPIWFFATRCSDKILLRRQIFSKKFSSTQEAICRCNMSPDRVAKTSCLTCTHGVICRCDLLLQLVA